MSTPEQLVTVRQDFRRHPEPTWCEFYTIAGIVAERTSISVSEKSLGIGVNLLTNTILETGRRRH